MDLFSSVESFEPKTSSPFLAASAKLPRTGRFLATPATRPAAARPAGTRRPAEDPFAGLGDETANDNQKSVSEFLIPVEMKNLKTLAKIIGLESIKMEIETLAELFAMTVFESKLNSNAPLKKRAEDYFSRYGRSEDPLFNILFEGVSGGGKTTLMEAFASQIQKELGTIALKVWKIDCGLIGTSLQRQSERNIANTFNMIKSGPQPCIVIIDEFDVLAATQAHGAQEVTRNMAAIMKDKIIELAKMKSVVVVFATNNINLIDPALRAPHRVRVIGIGVPPPETKILMFERVLDKFTKEGITVDVPVSVIEEKARNLQNGRATGASFEAVERALREARTGLLQGIERGRISVIVQQKKGKGKSAVSTDVVLRPLKPTGALPTVEQARSRFHIDASDGNSQEKYGLKIDHDGAVIKDVRMIKLTRAILDFALRNFESRRHDKIEDVAA